MELGKYPGVLGYGTDRMAVKRLGKSGSWPPFLTVLKCLAVPARLYFIRWDDGYADMLEEQLEEGVQHDSEAEDLAFQNKACTGEDGGSSAESIDCVRWRLEAQLL
jgi:hypothetical protein